MAVKSAERVFRIFELLEQSPEGLTNKEVSSLLGFAPSSTLALLQTMEENGYLSADEQKRYYLGQCIQINHRTDVAAVDICNL